MAQSGEMQQRTVIVFTILHILTGQTVAKDKNRLLNRCSRLWRVAARLGGGFSLWAVYPISAVWGLLPFLQGWLHDVIL